MIHVTPEGRSMIAGFEGLRLLAYLDTGGVWTIGYGTTRYPPWQLEGRRVLRGDVCTGQQADEWLAYDLRNAEAETDALTIDSITPFQFDGLTSLVYNCGAGSYRTSLLRRLVNANPNDAGVRGQFMRWHFDNGKPIEGLWRRRHHEADHYEGIVTPCPPFPY